MSKVTDLRREVKERLDRRNITDLTEMKLKEIDLNLPRQKQYKKLENMAVKIGESLIDTILTEELPDEDKVKKIEDIINNGDFKVSIEILGDAHSEIIRLLNAVSKNKAKDDTFIKITVSDDKDEVFSYSWLNFDAKASNEGLYKLRNSKGGYEPVAGLRKILGMIFIANSINKYYKNNEDMAKITLLKFIDNLGIYKDAEQFNEVKEIKEKMNLPLKNDSKIVYTSMLGKNDDSVICRHIDWLDTKEYLTIDYIYEKESKHGRTIHTFRQPDTIIYLLNFLIELNKEEEDEVKRERSLSSDYAKSFQTKKNIPDKIMEKMKETSFLNYFGYVEFDESVDIEKIIIIEKEWEEINEKISFPVSKDHSLRFRRLGNHNAAGLYFPNAKAVCVDIRSPKSMVHEILHMIDYKGHKETLSSLPNFRGIIDLYREITNEMVNKLDKNDAFREKWEGNSKFNKVYFQNSKEIFARCGEIYVRKVLKIDSSLVGGDDNKLLYPEDDRLLSMIEKYYGNIIKENKKEEYTFSPIMEKILTKEMIADILKNGQMSMF